MNTYNMLIDIEQRCKGYSLELPQDTTQHKKPWVGIVFLLNKNSFVIELRSILEVIQSISISEVPCTVDWIMGITNFRGNLIPIIDLNKRIYGNFTQIHKKQKILILKHEKNLLGICISKIIGIKKFYSSEIATPDSKFNPNHNQFIKRSFQDRNVKTYEVHVASLLEDFENNFLIQET